MSVADLIVNKYVAAAPISAPTTSVNIVSISSFSLILDLYLQPLEFLLLPVVG